MSRDPYRLPGDPSLPPGVSQRDLDAQIANDDEIESDDEDDCECPSCSAVRAIERAEDES